MRAIVLLLYFSALAVLCTENPAGNSVENPCKPQPVPAGESVEGRLVQAEMELKRLRGEYTALQQRYAELYEKSSGVLERLKQLELRATDLILQKEETDSAKSSLENLEALRLAFQRQVEVQDTLARFEKFLIAWTEVLQPSKAMRLELAGRLADLKRAVHASLQPMAQAVAPEEGSWGNLQRCSVLSVNRDEQLVFLDCGLFSGVRPGFRWRLCAEDGRVLVRLLTVDCRQQFSAAVVTQGSLDAVGSGCVLQPETARGL